MVDNRWKQVTCKSCGRSYQCTPADDYYNATSTTDGVCEPCLLGNEPPFFVIGGNDATS